MKMPSLIEPLEDRIAPALILNPFTVTYQNYETDSNGNQIQGDTVLVKISRPLFTSVAAAQNILLFTGSAGTQITEPFTGNTTAETLAEINLQGNNAAAGMNISVTVLPQLGIGNMKVSVGDINAGLFTSFSAIGNIPLGSIYIQGALEQISAGGDFSNIPAIQSLTVGSFGGAGGAASIVLGTIDNFTVVGNFTAAMEMIGYQFGAINHLTIGGSLTGDGAGDANTGYLQFSGHIGSATIGNITGSPISSATDTGELNGITGFIGSLHVTGSITGGAAASSGGVIVSGGNIQQLIVNGSINGGSGTDSGFVGTTAGSIGGVYVGGSITGGSGSNSGDIASSTNIGSLQVAGSIVGGSGVQSGVVEATQVIGKVIIGNNLMGGTAGTAFDSSTNAQPVKGYSGVIESAVAGSITIGGSLIGGTPNPNMTVSSGDSTSNATADTSGVILVNEVGAISIMGSIIANGGPNSALITGQSGSLSPFQVGSPVNSYGAIYVGGDVTGGAGALSGAIMAGTQSNSTAVSSGYLIGSIKTLYIGGSVTGGAGLESGDVYAFTSLGNAYIGGSITGGGGVNAGSIASGGILGSLHIAQDLAGSSGSLSGSVSSTSTLGTLFIGGGVKAGTTSNTGEIMVDGGLINATIVGNLEGTAASFSSATAVVDAGYIQAGHIGTLAIMGNVTSGTNTGGPIANSGAIRSSTDILSLTIGGVVTGTAADPVIISAQQGPATAAHLTSDLAIANLAVGGAATYLDVLAGYGPTVSMGSNVAGQPLGVPMDGSAQIGTVSFHSTLSASNIVAGATPDSNGQFGTTGDTALPPRTEPFSVISSIAKITVAGTLTGDSAPATDNFGIVAESVGALSVNSAIVSLANLIPGTPILVPSSTNVFVLEPLLT
jgi:hypothetical protein